MVREDAEVDPVIIAISLQIYFQVSGIFFKPE